MSRLLAALALGTLLAPAARASAQTRPDSAARGADAKTEYDAHTDSTTRSLSAYAIVDTSMTPPDTFAVELSQRWKGRATAAPVAAVELGLGRTRAGGLRASRTLRRNGPARPDVVFVVDGGRSIRLHQSEYVSGAGDAPTFETARYHISPADLRAIAASRELHVRVGERALWIDPAWRRVAADVVAAQTP